MSEVDLSLEHLQAELGRIDVLIRREVRRWQLAGQDPSDQFRGLYVTDEQAVALLDRPFGTSWGQTIRLDPEEAEAWDASYAQAMKQARSLANRARKQGWLTRLDHMTAVFGLDQFELDVFLVSIAPSLDLRYERLYGYLQDDVSRKHAGVDLVLSLLCPPGPARLRMMLRFTDDAAMFKYHLLERAAPAGMDNASLLSLSLRPDPAIVSWLVGGYQPHADLAQHVQLILPSDNEEDQLLTNNVWPSVERVLDRTPVLVFSGVNTAAQHAVARRVAGKLKRPLLQVNMESVKAADLDLFNAMSLALRDAGLIGGVPYFTGWDSCLVKDVPRSDLLSELFNYPAISIVGGKAVWYAQNIARDRTLVGLEFPVPDHKKRARLWSYFVNHSPAKRDLDFADLAAQFVLTASQIRDAVSTAHDLATQRGNPLDMGVFFESARMHSSPRLAGLARKITPRYGWDDIILPKDQLEMLQEIVLTVRERSKVLDEWGIGKKLTSGAGVAVLFAGPPGTGKTMAAEVMAAALRLDIYKIDLSSVVSKYIGETEKNLEAIFNEAQSSNAILFFDEADALFGKRTEQKDAHDRYANIEISYLLQRMEIYDGLTILATNLRANLDEAFTRRLQFSINFPFPEEEYRLRIWQTLFPPDVPCAPDLDWEYMAQEFKFSGGNIRNVIVSAAYLAAAEDSVVTMDHLLHGTRRELQKMGRLIQNIGQYNHNDKVLMRK